MRKFKHKKTGWIVVEQRNFSQTYYSPETGNVAPDIVEDSNDWEEIIEKDYKILSLNIHDSRISDMIGHSDDYIQTLLKDRLTKIHSVKRLSDGEIFTIGDKVCFCNNYFIILGFRISNTNASNKLIVDVKSLENNLYYSYELQSVKHIKQPLFKTEDGVDIYENTVFYHVDLNWYIGSGRTTANNFQKLKGYKEFSTKEKAQEYIDLHKPKYSLNDIQNMFQFDGLITKELLTKRLKELNK